MLLNEKTFGAIGPIFFVIFLLTFFGTVSLAFNPSFSGFIFGIALLITLVLVIKFCTIKPVIHKIHGLSLKIDLYKKLISINHYFDDDFNLDELISDMHRSIKKDYDASNFDSFLEKELKKK